MNCQRWTVTQALRKWIFYYRKMILIIFSFKWNVETRALNVSASVGIGRGEAKYLTASLSIHPSNVKYRRQRSIRMNRPLFLPNWIFCIHFQGFQTPLDFVRVQWWFRGKPRPLNREATGELNIIEEDFIDDGNILRLTIIFQFFLQCIIKGKGKLILESAFYDSDSFEPFGLQPQNTHGRVRQRLASFRRSNVSLRPATSSIYFSWALLALNSQKTHLASPSSIARLTWIVFANEKSRAVMRCFPVFFW